MGKEELLQKELDLLREQFRHVGIKLNTLSYSRIAYAMKQYAIAMCEEKEREIYSQTDKEFWKDVIGYEGYYMVSSLGRVKSLSRTVTRGFAKNVKTEERVLNPNTNNKGYEVVPLIKNGIRKVYLVHRLVAEAFIPNLENKPFVNHKDLNTTNNMYSNLEWCTQSENIQHAHDNGAFPSKAKEVIDKNTGKTYISAKQAALELGLSYNSLRHQLCGSQPNTYGIYYNTKNVAE